MSKKLLKYKCAYCKEENIFDPAQATVRATLLESTGNDITSGKAKYTVKCAKCGQENTISM
jgi:DNA-directed RNA polymerase subunit RPC12/RpoP